jgi:predicted amidohydrolase
MATLRSFKLALLQMLVEGGAKAANLQRAGTLIKQAAGQGAQVVLLPETMDLGWTHPSARDHAEGIPDGTSCLALRQAAKENKVYVCAGLVERDGERVYNAAVLIDPRGEILAVYRKLNELGIGHGCYAQGDRLAVVPTPLGTFGVMICSDGYARDNVITQSLGYMGADVILSPCAWAVPSTHDNQAVPFGEVWRRAYKPRAREFQMWIAAVSNVGWITDGPWKGRKCVGCSMVVNPEGREVLMGPYGVDAETILYVDVKPADRPARGCRWRVHWGEREEPEGATSRFDE